MATAFFILFLLFTLINILFYIGYFRFASADPLNPPSKNIPVSVLVCAKNEAENLQQFLPSILHQNYPEFEIILINDGSVDNTLEVMEEFQQIDPRVKIVNVQHNEAFWGKKKYALTLGIKKSKYPYLLFTDADCVPETSEWISNMASHFQAETSIVLGYGSYFKSKISFLNKLIRFETLLTAIQYFSYAKWGIPYMGVGRNLAYTSSEFYSQNGFAGHLHIRSGDDDLFVNQAANAKNTSLCYSPSSITRSVPEQNIKNWFQQKRRHISTATLYKKKHQLLLGTFFFSQFAFYILFFYLLILQVHWEIALIVFIIRLLVQFSLFYTAAKKLDELDVVWLLPVLDLFLVSSQFGIFIANLFSKPNNWK